MTCRDCGQPCEGSRCDLHRKLQADARKRLLAKLTAAERKYRQIRYNGRRRKALTISKEEFINWFDSAPKVCCYCGIPEERLAGNPDKKKRKLTVDRKDSSGDYSLGNLCLACFRCNNSKSDFFTHEEWKQIAEKFVQPRLDEYHRLAG